MVDLGPETWAPKIVDWFGTGENLFRFFSETPCQGRKKNEQFETNET